MIREFPSKFDSTCLSCSGKISAGSIIAWDTSTKEVYHKDCYKKPKAEKSPKPARKSIQGIKQHTPSKPYHIEHQKAELKSSKAKVGTINVMKMLPAMKVFNAELKKAGVSLKNYTFDEICQIVSIAKNYNDDEGCPF